MDSLQNFFYPRSVALIGATDKPSKPGRAILENLSRFQGAVYPVNPKQFALRPALFCVNLIPDSVDLAVIALPAPLVPEEIDRVHEKGIRCVIIIIPGSRNPERRECSCSDRFPKPQKRAVCPCSVPMRSAYSTRTTGLILFSFPGARIQASCRASFHHFSERRDHRDSDGGACP